MNLRLEWSIITFIADQFRESIPKAEQCTVFCLRAREIGRVWKMGPAKAGTTTSPIAPIPNPRMQATF